MAEEDILSGILYPSVDR